MAFRLGAALAIACAMCRMSVRKPSTLFWLVAFPIFMITLTVYVFIPSPSATPAKTVKVLVVPEELSPELVNASKQLVEYMNRVEVSGHKLFNATFSEASVDEAIELLRNGTYDAVVVIPKDYVEELRNFRIHVKVYRLSGTLDKMSEQFTAYTLWSFFEEGGKTLVCKALALVLERASAYNITSKDPVIRQIAIHYIDIAFNNTVVEEYTVAPSKVESPEEIRRYVAGMMAVAMSFVEYMFIGVLGAGVAIVEKFERRYVERLFATRLSPWELFAGTVMHVIAEATFVTLVCLLYATYVLGAKYTITPLSVEALSVAILAFSAIILTTALGIVIGTLFKNTEAVSTVANIIIWPTMFLGGIWIPKWMIPEQVRWFADYNPLSQTLYAIYEIMTYGKPLTNYITTIATSTTLAATLFTTAALLYKKRIITLHH